MTNYRKITIAGGDTSQPLAMEKRLRLIKRYLSPERRLFLDCGCGAGDYVFRLITEFGLDAYGLEYSRHKVAAGISNAQFGHRISQGNLQNIDQPSSTWDYAMLNEVLEHIPDEKAALREIHRILKPGGLLFVFSPNRLFPFETHGVNFLHLKKKLPHWAPFVPYLPLALGSHFFHYWARNYWPWELARLLRSCNFEILESSYVWQTFENISGKQPRLLKKLKKPLQTATLFLENIPILKSFGVSQAYVCKRPSGLP